MDNARTYLLKKIISSHEGGEYEIFGTLNGKFVDPIAKVMLSFMKESLIEITDRLNDGETVDVDGIILSLNKKKKKA